MNEPEEPKIWCSVSEAITRLAAAGDRITQQRLTRYLNDFAEIPRRPSETDGRVTEVDFEALSKHRAENVRAQEHASKKSQRRDPAADDMRLRERRAIVEMREFQLAERKGELVTRAEVLRAVQGAGVALEQMLQRTRYERAEQLDAANGARAKAALLIEQDEALREGFADALKALSGGADAATDEEDELVADDDAGSPAEQPGERAETSTAAQ